MEDLDTLNNLSDEELLLKGVICNEADLLYIDSYLRELFRTN